MKLLREFIAQLLNEPHSAKIDGFVVPFLPHPPQGTESELADLHNTIHQHTHRRVPDSLQEAADSSMLRIFKQHLHNNGYPFDKARLKSIKKLIKPTIKRLKHHYARPRPHVVAKSWGIPWSGDYLESAQTPSYPSGHATQAYTVALILANQHPEEEENLLNIAEIVAQSRIDRGVHFQSDVDYGRELAYVLAQQILENMP